MSEPVLEAVGAEMIVRGGVDVTEATKARAEELRRGPLGVAERKSVIAVLSTALLALEQIPRPWLDDVVEDVRSGLRALRDIVELAGRDGAV